MASTVPLADQAKSKSTASFVTALGVNAAIFAIELVAFTVLRPYFKAIYEPRTYAPAKWLRVEPLAAGIFGWPMAIWRADYRDILKSSVDGYFFVRFLRAMVRIFLPIWFVSWAVLLPISSVGIDGAHGLDRFAYGNIPKTEQQRYGAHLILAYLFTAWICYNIRREMRHFIVTRQAHLIDPVHAATVKANTVLLTGIPAKYLSEKALFELFEHLPGGVKRVWLNRDLKDLPDIYERRLAASGKLESAETALLAAATKAHFKKDAADKGKGSEQPRSSTADTRPLTDPSIRDVDPERELGMAERLVPQMDRPTHRLPIGPLPFSLPFVGQKVDTINWCRDEIISTTEELERERRIIRGEAKVDVKPVKAPEELELEQEAAGPGESSAAEAARSEPKDKLASKDEPANDAQKYPPLNSAFVQFEKQIAAHLASQVLAHHEPYRMAAKYTEVSPDDVIWANLSLNPYEQKVRMVISYAATAGLIIAWSIPVTFVGALSNIYRVCSEYKWLQWICELPEGVVGVIAGILPPVLLAVLMMLLPIILRLLARFEGIPNRTGLELSLMSRFFIFQVIHSFLIVTLSSGLLAFLGEIKDDGISLNQVPNLLAANLPKASTFFLTYFVLQGLTGTAGGFLQIVPLILYYVKMFVLGSTPRAVYGIKYGLRNVSWGTLFPTITLLTTIALGYSIISPIINGLACATFFAYYMLYKYLFLYQFEQGSDTGGLFMPKAMNHIFVGLYVQQVCLGALFFLATGTIGVSCGALMIVLVGLTAFYQTIINNSYGPLIHALPLSLANKSWGVRPSADLYDEGFGNPTGVSTSHKSSPDGSVEMRDRGANSKRPAPDSRPTNETQDDRPMSLKKKLHSAEEVYGFTHPAVSRPQRTIWIPQDRLGLGVDEDRVNEARGIDTSTDNAFMNEKGKVEITSTPPDLIREDAD